MKTGPQKTSLAVMERAEILLAEANTIQKVKELKTLALTAAEWARQKGLGKKAEQHCYSYAMRAYIKMGEMLLATARAKGGQPYQKRSTPTSGIGVEIPPTIAELGLTWRESAEAQMLASLPQKQEAIIAHEITPAKVRREKQQQAQRDELVKAQAAITRARRARLLSVCDLRVCSCTDLFASGIRPDAVLTDPPYAKEFLSVFSELATACHQANVPLIAVMCGQSYLPEVMRRLCEHLQYRWALAYLTPGGQAVQQWAAKVNTAWKPVLLFGEAAEWFGDVARSQPNDNDKRFHKEGQSESGMADLVERLTKPGQLICDPFLGGGTTAVVSMALGRRFVGCDIDADAVAQSRTRIEAMPCEK